MRFKGSLSYSGHGQKGGLTGIRCVVIRGSRFGFDEEVVLDELTNEISRSFSSTVPPTCRILNKIGDLNYAIIYVIFK